MYPPDILAELKTDDETVLETIRHEDLQRLAGQVAGYVKSKRSAARVIGAEAPTQLALTAGSDTEYIDLTGLQPFEIEEKIQHIGQPQFA